MNRLDPKHQASAIVMTTTSSSNPSTALEAGPMFAGRLLVLVPPDLEYTAAIGRIWDLAVATSRHVQLLSLCKDMAKESSLRRQLTLMSALIGDSRVVTEAKVEIGANWLDVVKRIYQTGDIILCFTEPHTGLLHRPLKKILEAKLDAPIYILTGSYTQEYPSSKWISQTIAWTGSIGIIAGFFLLQSRIGLLPNDWIQTTLLILTTLFEFWLILVLNNRFQ
jgi:hypothetical protein